MAADKGSISNTGEKKFNASAFLTQPIKYIRSLCGPEMPHYKLTYFGLKGRAEIARQLFALAGVEYEDKRITFEEWPALKSSTPFGQLPLLEVDGVIIAQSITIARFLARRFGYAGENDIDAAKVDGLADTFADYFTEQKNFFPVLIGRVPGDKDALYKEVYEPARDKYIPMIIEHFLKKSTSGFLVGSKLSYADLLLAEHVSTFQEFLPHNWDKYPELLAHRDRIQAIPALKKWLETRPKTPF
ncbi:unnamed protein product, partial [Mesorhabditis spiculigera]